ncbi:MAG: hypothetical protein AAF487_10745 [Bacteroidota bacterium]
MNHKIIFAESNPEFDLEYAKEYHSGKETPENSKYIWKETFEIKNVKAYEVLKKETISVRLGFDGEKSLADYMIPNMRVIRLTFEDGSNEECAVSERILGKTMIFNNRGTITHYLIISTEEKFTKIGALIYLSLIELDSIRNS